MRAAACAAAGASNHAHSDRQPSKVSKRAEKRRRAAERRARKAEVAARAAAAREWWARAAAARMLAALYHVQSTNRPLIRSCLAKISSSCLPKLQSLTPLPRHPLALRKGAHPSALDVRAVVALASALASVRPCPAEAPVWDAIMRLTHHLASSSCYVAQPLRVRALVDIAAAYTATHAACVQPAAIEHIVAGLQRIGFAHMQPEGIARLTQVLVLPALQNSYKAQLLSLCSAFHKALKRSTSSHVAVAMPSASAIAQQAADAAPPAQPTPTSEPAWLNPMDLLLPPPSSSQPGSDRPSAWLDSISAAQARNAAVHAASPQMLQPVRLADAARMCSAAARMTSTPAWLFVATCDWLVHSMHSGADTPGVTAAVVATPAQLVALLDAMLAARRPIPRLLALLQQRIEQHTRVAPSFSASVASATSRRYRWLASGLQEEPRDLRIMDVRTWRPEDLAQLLRVYAAHSLPAASLFSVCLHSRRVVDWAQPLTEMDAAIESCATSLSHLVPMQVETSAAAVLMRASTLLNAMVTCRAVTPHASFVSQLNSHLLNVGAGFDFERAPTFNRWLFNCDTNE
ncbi:MAG: hypothetical protein EOO41_02850, partial [Methanobacteriota archaeon]